MKGHMKLPNYHVLYRYLLWLFVIHTTCVAIGLIVLPGNYLIYFGLVGYQGRFFQVQAGVFHLVMGVAYLLAIYHGEKQPGLVYFAVIAKSMAFVFLLFYSIFMERSWIIILSGIGDGVMGLILLIIYRRLKQSVAQRSSDVPDMIKI
jgi:hypothetical protein